MFASNTSAANGAATYIEDVFSTYLYTGNGSTQTITNGIDLAGKGGMVWTKMRPTASTNHHLWDTDRGVYKELLSNTPNPEYSDSTGLTAFNSSGFSVGSQYQTNNASSAYASWTFRKQPKFFDVVTYTGSGASGKVVNHSLGSVPGCIIIKRTDGTGDAWCVWHRGIHSATNETSRLILNTTDANTSFGGTWLTSVTSTAITFAAGFSNFNASGATYVAYLFAHNAGGFGLTGTDNVISCGSYTGNGSATGPSINLGFEAQWLLVKNATTSGHFWHLFDNVRGWYEGSADDRDILVNMADAENGATTGSGNWSAPTSTGFKVDTASGELNTSGNTYIYIAIRRGPMKIPTSASAVFSPLVVAANTDYTYGTDTRGRDWILTPYRNTASNSVSLSVLTGLAHCYTPYTTVGSASYFMSTQSTGGETASSNIAAYNNGFIIKQDFYARVSYCFKRAPQFFDVVCYTGTGVARTVNHNLGVAPEFMIVKSRTYAGSVWGAYHTGSFVAGQPPQNCVIQINSTGATYQSAGYWNNTAPTASVFSVSNGAYVNNLNDTYVAYLFATCPGVSKVGSYTGTGTTQQINCGFTGGARFVLIKRTDSTGDWYVWDSARGIVAGNDPYLLLNSTAAEVTTTDYVDTYSAGFEISSTAPAAINASGGTFIYLAIA